MNKVKGKYCPLWAAPQFGQLQRAAVLDLFPPKSLDRIEDDLDLPLSSRFRATLAYLVWKRLRIVPSLKNIKRRIDRLLAKPELSDEDLTEFTRGLSESEAVEVGACMLLTGLSVQRQDAARRKQFVEVMAGKKPNYHDHCLMAKLAWLYEQTPRNKKPARRRAGYSQLQGHEQYYGPFIELVTLVDNVVAKALDRRRRTNATIGNIVKAVAQARTVAGVSSLSD